MDDKRIFILKEERVPIAIMKMALPVVAGMMIQILYNMVDTFFVGMLKDANQLAATNLTLPVFMVLMSIAGLIGTGAASFISRSLGEKRTEQATRTLSVSVVFVLIAGLLATVFGLIFSSPLVKLLGASSQTAPYAEGYVIPLFVGAIFIMGNFALGQILRSEGAAMDSMKGMLIGTVANIILDPLFIFVFKMGVTGAAVATVIGNALGLAFYLYFYLSGKSLLKIQLKKGIFQKVIIKNIFLIGTPSTISQILAGVAMAVCNNLAAGYGDITVAAYGVAGKIITIGTFMFMGFGAGLQPLVGYNFGAKNFTRMKAIIKQGIGITALVGIVLTVTFLLFGENLIAVFTPLQEVIDVAVRILNALLWSLPFWGAIMLSSISVQAMGKPLAALLLSVLRQGMIYIPTVLIMNAVLGFYGLIYAQPIADFVSLLLSLTVLQITLRRSERDYLAKASVVAMTDTPEPEVC